MYGKSIKTCLKRSKIFSWSRFITASGGVVFTSQTGDCSLERLGKLQHLWESSRAGFQVQHLPDAEVHMVVGPSFTCQLLLLSLIQLVVSSFHGCSPCLSPLPGHLQALSTLWSLRVCLHIRTQHLLKPSPFLGPTVSCSTDCLPKASLLASLPFRQVFW